MTIRTTHVGSLPRTPELIQANRARREGSLGEADFTSLLQDQVDGVRLAWTSSTTASTAMR